MKKLFILFLLLPFCSFSQNNYISNKDYNEFITYVRDSLFRLTMGEEVDEEAYLNVCHNCDEGYFPSINWKKKLDINTPWAREVLEPWYYKPEERLNRNREFDTKKFIHNKVRVYPDVMVWCRDSTINKSWATFLAKNYFNHPYFENYPVQGVSEIQLEQYLEWKYSTQNKKVSCSKKDINLKLPKEKLKITVGDYFKFYQHTRDSVALRILAEDIDESKYYLYGYNYFENGSLPILNWKRKIKWNNQIISKVLKDNALLTSDNKIDNRRIMYVYSYLNYYRASILPDTIDRSTYFTWQSINLCANKYIPEFSSINIKSNLKNNETINLQDIDIHQLIAYYHWKKDNYNGKDVFENFIPYYNDVLWEEDPIKFMEDNDIELLRKGELPDSFYNFSISIPVIQIITAASLK